MLRRVVEKVVPDASEVYIASIFREKQCFTWELSDSDDTGITDSFDASVNTYREMLQKIYNSVFRYRLQIPSGTFLHVTGNLFPVVQ